MNFYKRYPGDYARDTGTLSLAEHGAYTLLLDCYYSTGGIPKDDRELFTLCRAMTAAERRSVLKVVAKFFPDRKNPRADEEIAKWNEKATQNREIGKLGGRPKGNPEETQTVTQTITQTVSKIEPKENPLQKPEARIKKEDSRRGEAPSVDQAIFAEARLIFGSSIGGQIGKAIKVRGKPWTVGIIEACRKKDPEQARAYLAAALNGTEKPDEAAQRRQIA